MVASLHTYRDLQDHLKALDDAGLLWTIDEPVDKDSEMHPLVRWQFRGGLAESDRKAFLFKNVVNGNGRKYDIPVAVGALAVNQEVYGVGMGVQIDEIAEKWHRAINNPIPPRIINAAPCQEIVWEADDLVGEGKGLDALPIPVSTPGFDSAPTLSATNCITKDPKTGVYNMGTYRCGLKASDRLVIRMATRVGGAGGYLHWKEYKKLGEKMPCAIVLGCPPYVAFTGPQKLPIGMDEVDVAGGLAGEPINMVNAKSVSLLVPAEAEVIIEGLIDPEVLEPEGPFGESHGHVALEEFNMPLHVTTITRKKNAVIPSYISQVAPSESSVIKRTAYEPLFFNHLQKELGIKGIKRVALHEPLTGLLRVIFIIVENGMARTEVWRALNGAAAYKGDMGKITIAVNEDIDPDSADSILWALAYRHNPSEDLVVLPHRNQGHGPKRGHGQEEDGTLLIDATMKEDMPPLALPEKEYMEKAKELWKRLGLPSIRPEVPWHGYSLGDWHLQWTKDAKRAAEGDYLKNGKISHKRQQRGRDFPPETSVRDIEEGWDKD